MTSLTSCNLSRSPRLKLWSVTASAQALLRVARNHPFVTGNKRTAWTATAMFYMINGYNVPAEAGEVLGLTVD
jgi:death-on-curing protein